MTTQQARAARRTILAWAIRLADERAELDILTDTDGTPVAHLTWNIAQTPKKRTAGTTCLCYYGETGCPVCPDVTS